MSKITFTLEPGTLVSTLPGQSEDRHEKHHIFEVHKDDGGEYVKVKTMVEPFRITQIHRGRLHMVLKTSGYGSGDPPPRPEPETPTDAREPIYYGKNPPAPKPLGDPPMVSGKGAGVLRFYFPYHNLLVWYILDLLNRKYSAIGDVPIKGRYVLIPVNSPKSREFSIWEGIDPELEFMTVESPQHYAWAVSCLHPAKIGSV